MSSVVSQLESQAWDNGRVSGRPGCREGLERHRHVEKVQFFGVGEIVEGCCRGNREVNMQVFEEHVREKKGRKKTEQRK